jgi:hypothetical protein
MIRGIQSFQITMPTTPYSSIDSADTNRYRLALPVGAPMYD